MTDNWLETYKLNLMLLPDCLQEQINADALWATTAVEDERSQDPAKILEVEKERRVDLLFQHYKIQRHGDSGHKKLLSAVLEDFVPGFSVVFSDVSEEPIWSDAAYRLLAYDVSRQLTANEGLSERKALHYLAGAGFWRELLERNTRAISKNAVEACQQALSRQFRYAKQKKDVLEFYELAMSIPDGRDLEMLKLLAEGAASTLYNRTKIAHPILSSKAD